MEKKEALSKEKIESKEEKKETTQSTPEALKITALIALYGKCIGALLEDFWKKYAPQGELEISANGQLKLAEQINITQEGYLYSLELLEHLKKGLIPNNLEQQFAKYPRETWGVFVARRLEIIQTIEDAIKSGITQFISLGSGLEPLLEEVKKNHPHVNCFEMDFPNTITQKKSVLKQKIPTQVIYKKGDITTDFDKFFEKKNPEKRPKKDIGTLCILEGVTPYLERDEEKNIDENIALLTKLETTFTGELIIWSDYMTEQGIKDIQAKYPKAAEVIDALKKQGVYIRTGYNKFKEEVANNAGLEITEKSLYQVTQERGLGKTPYGAQQNHWVVLGKRKAPEKSVEENVDAVEQSAQMNSSR